LATRRQANAKAFALAAARVAAGRHCSDVVVLDLKGKSPATDYFVIATGSSDRQMRTVADEISEAARDFDSDYRDYYNLEMLWGDARRLKID